MNARNEAVSIIEETGYPCWLMNQMPENVTYPHSFFTYRCEDAPYGEYYDNRPRSTIWTFGIAFYSDDPFLVGSETKELIERLAAAGWIIDGDGDDVPSDEPTHTGRRIVAYKIDYNF